VLIYVQVKDHNSIKVNKKRGGDSLSAAVQPVLQAIRSLAVLFGLVVLDNSISHPAFEVKNVAARACQSAEENGEILRGQ
jgi:hypothetical protein